MTRRTVITSLPPALAGAYSGLILADSTPKLAEGTPKSPQRLERIAALRKKVEGLSESFEERVHNGKATRMPYRLFRATGSGAAKVPLILYLHGSGGLGDDNRKQIALGNLFGSHVWAVPENQKRYPCCIVAPQTSMGWIRYDAGRTAGGSRPNPIPGFGEGARLALEIVSALCKEFPIDQKRLYVMGNSMGGGGTWHILAHHPGLFAAAVPVAGSRTIDPLSNVGKVPLWNFHGDADQTVAVEVSRERIAALRKAGSSPIYTEYSGVGHDANQWAFTEPVLMEWLFAQRLPVAKSLP